MALQDILRAITEEADRQIADMKAQHKQYMKDMKREHAQALQAALYHIDQQTEQKKFELRSRAQAQATMTERHAVLRKKQALLDQLYANLIDALAALPDGKAQKIVEHCLRLVTDNGVLYPAKKHEALLRKLAPAGCTIGNPIDAKGGFRFVGERQEGDFTFEFLVQEVLRPHTQIAVAHSLFSSAA